jgi:hypothetical protein
VAVTSAAPRISSRDQFFTARLTLQPIIDRP